MNVVSQEKFHKICENPSNFRKEFKTEEEYTQMVNACAIWKQMNNLKIKISGGDGGDGIDLGDVVNKIFMGFVSMLLSPEFWAFYLGFTIGIPVLEYFIKTVVPKILRLAVQGIVRISEWVGIKTIPILITRISSIFNTAVRKIVTPATEFLVRTGIQSAVREGLSVVAEFIDAVLITMMLVDFTNPCGFSPPSITDGKKWAQAQDQMNLNFGTNILGGAPSPSKGYGVHGNLGYASERQWPMEVDFGKAVLAQQKMSSDLETYFFNRWLFYNEQYLYALVIDSTGRPIIWKTMELNPTTSQLKALEHNLQTQMAYALADRNTVVANWFIRYGWILIIVAVAIVITVIFYL
jgi:hypothetical protein